MNVVERLHVRGGSWKEIWSLDVFYFLCRRYKIHFERNRVYTVKTRGGKVVSLSLRARSVKQQHTGPSC